MTFDEFMQTMLNAFPDAVVEEDNGGQLIVYTGLRENSDGSVVSYVADYDD